MRTPANTADQTKHHTDTQAPANCSICRSFSSGNGAVSSAGWRGVASGVQLSLDVGLISTHNQRACTRVHTAATSIGCQDNDRHSLSARCWRRRRTLCARVLISNDTRRAFASALTCSWRCCACPRVLIKGPKVRFWRCLCVSRVAVSILLQLEIVRLFLFDFALPLDCERVVFMS